jgi:hypothetical protein|uniref:Glycosyltransferase n=1 Tax=viral metagenome TaxID=1070528 RepID=A0A6C0CXP5_9ZZZZ
MLKIAFHTPQIDIRGSCTAIFDYAYYNEKILGNNSIIVLPYSSIDESKNDLIAIRKFQKYFYVYFYKNYSELDSILSNCNIFYQIHYGKRENSYLSRLKNVIHCVFDLSEPHGDVYASVSDVLGNKFGINLYVPHMVGLPPSETGENLRNELGISESATVFGYHGGSDAFNIDFVKDIIKKVIRENKDLYFIFVNTPRFDHHSNIFFLEKLTINEDKNKFICSCDAMIHAQKLGETFGLSIAEFSVNNKPIITYGGWTWNTNHKNILGDKAIYYTENNLYDILTNFDKNIYINTDLNCYKEFSPDNVMKKFKEVFID